MAARWFLRRRLIYPAAAVFCIPPPSPDLVRAHQRKDPPPRPALQLAETAPPAYEEAKRDFDRLIAAAEEARKSLDRTNFDPLVRAAAIGPKVEDLFAFVRDQIAYHPYRGVLRFAEGTLMSRAGNSCDKSLLLAAMLRHHGHKVRFARAMLDERMAQALVRISDMPPAAASRSPIGFETRAVLAAVMKRAGVAAAKVSEAIAEDDKYFSAFGDALVNSANYSAGELAQILKSAGVDFTGKASADSAAAAAAARDHCWVQVERQGNWVDLDPSAYRIKLGGRLAEPAAVGDALPPDLAFRLRFVVTIENSDGDKIERITVLDHTAPLMDAVTKISVGFIPEDAAKGDIAKLAGYGKFTVFWPVVRVRGQPIAGEPFDVAGRKLARNPQQRMSDTVGRGFGGALGGARASELRRVALTLTVTAPGGRESTVERELAVRAAGPREAAEANLKYQLLGNIDLAASGSRIDEAYVSARVLDDLISARPLLEHLLKVENKLAKADQWSPKPLGAAGDNGEALNYLFLRSNLIEARIGITAPSVIGYAAEPQIVAYRRKVLPGIDPKLRVSEGYDVIANALRAYDDPLRKPEERPAAVAFKFEQGIIDTALEYVLMGGGDTVNAHSVTVAAQAREGDRALVLIRPEDSAGADRLQVDAATKAAIKQDLARGFLVVAPVRPADIGGQPRYAWWRIDAKTGEALGIGGDGAGQSFTEWLIENASIVASSMLWCLVEDPAFWDAQQHFDGGDYLRCVAKSAVIGLLLFNTLLLMKNFALWGKFARPSSARARPPSYPNTPKPPVSSRPLSKGGVWDLTKGGGPARPGSLPPTATPTPPPSTGRWLPGTGPRGTQIVDVPWTIE